MIVGGGAREHTISDAYERSRHVKKIIVAPGNSFIGYKRKKEVVIADKCSLTDPESILEIAKKYKPDIVDVAQDDALAAGTVDLLSANGFDVFGPKKSASRIEWDKKWSREFMKRHDIPSPKVESFDSGKSAKEYVESIYGENPDTLLYVKAYGLCAGKGALRAENLDEAVDCIDKMASFGDAGKVFLIEEGLVGEEFSYYAISDGNSFHTFKSAQDNKTVFNFDLGDQTGGMGAVCPAKITDRYVSEIDDVFISKVIEGMKSEDNPYTGILYFGGINTLSGINTIEYNSRWGDPECQAVLPSVKTDYVNIVTSCLNGNLDKLDIKQDDKVRVCVVGSTRGYPGDYSGFKDKRIYGLEDVLKMRGVKLYSAAIYVVNDHFYTDGGRLFSVVAQGKNILEAKKKAYSAMARISIEDNGLHYRTDIGWRDLERFILGL